MIGFPFFVFLGVVLLLVSLPVLLFENFIVADILKQILHNGLNCQLYFYRTSHGEELDLIIDRGSVSDLIEIKASVTFRPGFQSIFNKINLSADQRIIVYQGENSEKTGGVKAMNYQSFLNDFTKVEKQL